MRYVYYRKTNYCDWLCGQMARSSFLCGGRVEFIQVMILTESTIRHWFNLPSSSYRDQPSCTTMPYIVEMDPCGATRNESAWISQIPVHCRAAIRPKKKCGQDNVHDTESVDSRRELVANFVHIADADARQLDSWVASASAVCTDTDTDTEFIEHTCSLRAEWMYEYTSVGCSQ